MVDDEAVLYARSWKVRIYKLIHCFNFNFVNFKLI